MWVWGDLSDDELRHFAGEPCECRTARRHGVNFRCPAHRAQDELDRRYPTAASERAAAELLRSERFVW